MLVQNDISLNFDLEEGTIGKITKKRDEEDEDGFRKIKDQYIKVTSVNSEDGKFEVEYEEITEEEAQQIRKNGDYVDELADALKDKLDSKELLKDALSEMDTEERKELLDDLEDEETDTEVENEGGCHQLVVNKDGEEQNRIMVRH